MTIFKNNAEALWARGLAVLPAEGKRPLVHGFHTWKRRPPLKTVARWGDRTPDANIAVLPGLSGHVIVDVDERSIAGEVESIFGATPCKVETRRGRHLYYRAPKGGPIMSADLRPAGLVAEIKARGSIIIAPPSIHEAGDATYAWSEGSGVEALRDLPPFPARALDSLLQKPKRAGRVREGQRGLALNRELCRHAWACHTFEELLDKARTINDDFEPPIDDDEEVVKRTLAVWNDLQSGKLKRWVGGQAVVRCTVDEVLELSGFGRDGDGALKMPLFFRARHGARCRDGKTFVISPDAMAARGTVPGMTRKRIEKAGDLLLELGKIRLVAPARMPSRDRIPRRCEASPAPHRQRWPRTFSWSSEVARAARLRFDCRMAAAATHKALMVVRTRAQPRGIW